MLGARGICRDEGQVDFGFLGRRKLDLRLFCRFLQALQRKLVATFLFLFLTLLVRSVFSLMYALALTLNEIANSNC
jgi:hypothetical protein